jgi:hypothetical protein
MRPNGVPISWSLLAEMATWEISSLLMSFDSSDVLYRDETAWEFPLDAWG